MLLTYMPSGWDYLLLFSAYDFVISFALSLLATGITGIIKKQSKTFRYYVLLWLKIFLISFFALLLIAFIIFFMV